MEEFDSDISQITRGEKPQFMSRSYSDLKPLHRSEKGAFVLYRTNHFGKWVVLKALKEEYRNDPFFETILQKEFSLGYQLNHHGVVSTIDFINLPEIGNAIVIEYLNGCTLRQYLKENTPLSHNEALRIINEIGEATAYLHANKIIHRDLKPENIMIDGSTHTVKIIDLGCADASDYNVIKGPAGTRHYAAPEQLSTEGKIDVRTDIYAIGKIILDITSVTNQNWRKAIQIANKCSEDNPADRYSSITELLNALNKTRKLPKAIIIAITIIAIIIRAVIILWRGDEAPTPTTTETKSVKTDTVYKTDTIVNIAPTRSNQEIADSIYNSKATIIRQELDRKLNAAYTQLEHADNVNDMAKYEPQIEDMFPGLLDSTRNELAQYTSGEILEKYISDLNKLFYEIRYNYRIAHVRAHFKNLYYNLGDSAGFKTMELFLTKQGYK